MKPTLRITIACAAALLLTAVRGHASAVTGAPNFSVIPQNNIFNRQRHESAKLQPLPIPSFRLSGTLSYDDTSYAFFDGTSRQLRNQVLKPAQTIGGYRISGIANDSVTLSAPGEPAVILRVGAPMAALVLNQPKDNQ